MMSEENVVFSASNSLKHELIRAEFYSDKVTFYLYKGWLLRKIYTEIYYKDIKSFPIFGTIGG